MSLCPEVMVRDDLIAGRMVKLPWDTDYVETGVIMIWHSDKWCSPLLKRFMDIATQTMGVNGVTSDL